VARAGSRVSSFAKEYAMFPRRGRTAALEVLAGCTAAALTLSGCHTGFGHLQHRTSTYSIAQPVHTLVVNDRVGDVQVTGAAGRVWVTARISYRHKIPETTHVVRAGTLTLDSTCPASETCGIDYDVRLPPGTAVTINDSVGNLTVAALTGPVTAYTNTGRIDLRSLSGTVRVTDHTGSVKGSGVSSATAALATDVGGIDVTFSAAPATLSATSSVGSITLRLPRGVSYAVDAGTTVGSTQVTVPQASTSAHVITAHTKTGSVTIQPT
jgi:hypothetical protein